MSRRPTIAILHHLAQSGGPLVCRCLGSMPQMALLSEIHPLATDRFSPLKQARNWYALVSAEELRDGRPLSHGEFLDAMELIHRRCQERSWRLVVSDWTHLDFTGRPFVAAPAFRFQREIKGVRNQKRGIGS